MPKLNTAKLSILDAKIRVASAVTGFVLVHIAAGLLYTATAPYLGAIAGIIGLALFMAGSRSPARDTISKKSFYLKA